MRNLLLITLLLLTTSCATSVYSLSDAEKDGIVQDTFNHPQEEVYQVSLNRLIEKGWTISNSDKESGIITTEWQTKSNLFGAARSRATVNIRQLSDTSTKVILNMQGETRSGGGWSQVVITRKQAKEITKPFFDALRSDLKNQASQ